MFFERDGRNVKSRVGRREFSLCRFACLVNKWRSVESGNCTRNRRRSEVFPGPSLSRSAME